MTSVPNLREIPDLPQEIEAAAKNGDLVLFVGAGVSRLAGLPSWEGLAWDVLCDLQKEGMLNFSELEQLKHLNPKKQLSIAEIIAGENIFRKRFATHLENINEEGDLYKFINDTGFVCVTTNYDRLLNPRFFSSDDDSISSVSGKRVSIPSEFHGEHLNSPGTVVHLHGSIDNPTYMVITEKDYFRHYDNDFVKNFLKELFEKKIVLFVGYGLEETEILEHIFRRGRAGTLQIKKQFLLQGYFSWQKSLYEKLYEYYSSSFDVQLIGFIRDEENYGQLKSIFKNWSRSILVRPPPLSNNLEFMDEVIIEEANLSEPKARDLLFRIEKTTALQQFFFQKAKGLHWFKLLEEKGYFLPENNPKPVPSKEEGFINFPRWYATEYLVSTASELNKPEHRNYAEKFLAIIRNTTQYAQENDFENWFTWNQFAKMISFLPVDLLEKSDLGIIDFWLSGEYNTGLIAEEIGNWLEKLLEGDEERTEISEGLIKVLFPNSHEKVDASISEEKVRSNLESWHVHEILKKVSRLSGEKIGISAVKIFESRVVSFLDASEKDSESLIWRPAIENHDQNIRKNQWSNILMVAYRDSLIGAVKNDLGSSKEYIKQLLTGRYETLRRVAIYVADSEFDNLNSLTKEILKEEFFNGNLRHEMWNFLNHHFSDFEDSHKEKVLSIIQSLKSFDEEEIEDEARTAYKRSIWYATIKDIEPYKGHYLKCIEIAKAEPPHPQFPLYMESGWVSAESPIPVEELLALSTQQLIDKTDSYVGRDLEGFARDFRKVVKSKANDLYMELKKFANLDIAFIYEVLEAYRELWNEKSRIQWNEIWPKLIEFCSELIREEEFWSKENSNSSQVFVGNRDSVVGSIAELIEDGTKSDQHAFSPDLLTPSLNILKILLAKQKGKKITIEYDAVSMAINSPRGKCLKALVNHALRSFRLADNEKNERGDLWRNYEYIFDHELKQSAKGVYEFSAIVTQYLGNFMFLSKEWVKKNLSKIFNQGDYQQWLCAMQGSAYVNLIYEEVYSYLKENGDYLKALDDENLKDYCHDKVIQSIAISFIHGNESVNNENSLISRLLERAKYDEFKQLICFIWTLDKQAIPRLAQKALELWPKLLEKINFDAKDGRKLASSLCRWAAFIKKIDENNQKLLFKIVPYADEDYCSVELIENLARISRTQPLEAQKIWMEMLKSYSLDYPEEAIREFLGNLSASGAEGKRKALEVVDGYIRHGVDRPRKWFEEIKKMEKTAE